MDYLPLGDWSAGFMFVTALLCFMGLLSRNFNDNLLQTVAMALGMIGCGSRCVDLWGRTEIPLDWFLIHACMGLFSLGVAWKVIRKTYDSRITLVVSRLQTRMANMDVWQRRDPPLAMLNRHEDQ